MRTNGRVGKKGFVRIVRYVDLFIFLLCLIVLSIQIFFFSRANIIVDPIDYYVILQRLTGNDEQPLVENPHFAEQRSPGYSIASMIPYYVVALAVYPFVKTEKIVDSPEKDMLMPHSWREPEGFMIPSKPLLSKDIFFKDFYIEREGSWFEWRLIFSLLFTSYFFLFIGAIFIAKTLSLESKAVVGASLIALVIFTSRIFLHNIINTPAYATLTAFGVISIFCYFFVKSFLRKKPSDQFLCGLAMGFLTLTRLEAVVLFCVSLILITLVEGKSFLKNYIAGFLSTMFVLLLYNLTQFGNPFHLGILRGDINRISLNFSYIFASLLAPSSGIFFWSPLISIGIVGLFFSREKCSWILGACSVALIGVYIIRVPIMYLCVGEGAKIIGSIPIGCARDMADALNLIRYDMNRYMTIFTPFSVLGLRNLIVFVKNRTNRVRLSHSQLKVEKKGDNSSP